MIEIHKNMHPTEIEKLIYKENLNLENAEVILMNLLELKNQSNTGFEIPFEDVLVTIRAALSMIRG
ncbi:hypothetical protein [Alteromonas sp. P256]|uniref:hypothetical protein n=1 Tax=Alteromonas sp. P256 TaxID=3117399 RepID=UPI002FDFF57F